MTGLERIRAAVAHKPTDIVPFHPYVSMGYALHLLGHETHEMFTVPGLLPRAMISACKRHNSDMIYCRHDMYKGDDYDMEEHPDGVFFKDKETGEPVYRVQRDLHNLVPLRQDDDPLRINHIDEVEEKMPVTPAEEIAAGPQGDTVRTYRAALGDDVALFAGAVGVTIKALRYHRGFEQGLMDLWLDPELAEAIMWRRVEQLREYAKALAMLGAHGYYTGDAEASCNVVSPEIFHRMLLPVYKAHIRDIKEAGLIALLHICGKSNGILEDVAATGADIFESLDPPSLGGDIDLADAKRRIGRKVCLKGNLDAPGVIEPGPSDAVYDASVQCMHAAADGGGYILSTEQVTPCTPPDHIFAMERARREFSASQENTT